MKTRRKLGSSCLTGLAILIVGCGTADDGVDPGDLAARDLLGLDPSVALRWGPGDRAAARDVLEDALEAQRPTERRALLEYAPGLRDAVVGSFIVLDRE